MKLPCRFFVHVNNAAEAEQVQRAMIALGYEWALSRKELGPRLKVPHIAVAGWTRRDSDGHGTLRMRVIRDQTAVHGLRHNKYTEMGMPTFMQLARLSGYQTAEEIAAEAEKFSGSKGIMVDIGMAPSFTKFFDPETLNMVTKRKVRRNGWKFESRHAGDIDFISIYNDLSTKNPVALVRGDEAGPDDEVWLVVHYKILLKAGLLKMDLLEGAQNAAQERNDDKAVLQDYPLRNMLGRVYRLPLRYTKHVIEAVRMVKHAPWPQDADKVNRKIVVTTPEV